MSLWVFSIIFEVSATFILGALWIIPVVIDQYISARISNVSGSEADTTFAILSTVCSLSHGLILSGEYPTWKSWIYFNPLFFSRRGIQISSVHPGSTVDSYTMVCHFSKTLPIIVDALINGI